MIILLIVLLIMIMRSSSRSARRRASSRTSVQNISYPPPSRDQGFRGVIIIHYIITIL